MARALGFLLTCCALAQAADDSTALLQAVGVDDHQREGTGATSSLTEALTIGVVFHLAKFNFYAKHADFPKLWKTATQELGENAMNSTWPEIPGFGAMHDFMEMVRINKIGLDLVMDALHEARSDQSRMVNETSEATEAYHSIVGEEFSIKNATQQQLEEAKPALLRCMKVYRTGWQRGIDIGKKNAERVQKFYTEGEGSTIPNMNSGITDMMSPERVETGTKYYTEGLNLASTALAAEAKTLEEARQQFEDARKGFLKLQQDVNADQEKTLKGKRNGKTMKNFNYLRGVMTMVVGKDVMDKLEETIEISELIAERTEEMTDNVAHFLLE